MAQSESPEAQRIVYLVSRYINGVIDFTELQELDNWKKEDSTNVELFQELIDDIKQIEAIKKMQTYDSKGSLQKIRHQMASTQKGPISLQWRKMAVAASILLATVLVVLFISKQKPQLKVNSPNTQALYIAPGTDKATLTLAGGERINLDGTSSGVIATQGGMDIQKTADNKIIYRNLPASNNITATGYNTIETPRGGKYAVQLPDGTNVWLNAASSLRYPAKFTGKQRIVELRGEAFFQVVHNEKQPFIVRTSTQDVTDIGTAFNINAYPDEPYATTSLQEGSALVSTKSHRKMVVAGQQSLNTSGRLNVSQADIQIATAWKNGQLAFQRTDIKAVLRQISRWYNVDIVYQGAPPDITISGGLSRQEDLSAVLKMLELSEVKFIQQGHKLIISR